MNKDDKEVMKFVKEFFYTHGIDFEIEKRKEKMKSLVNEIIEKRTY